ncbi:MAG: BatA domain-containing protein [Kiritimatiellae bacterium]|nr:BatA domain-containing protein [Kiritimatiellia bacterium]
MWSFLNPLFLSALTAALIPLILHLWQRQRIVIVPFSTVRFLKLAQKRSSNRMRLENILLWLLRTLILLLLALAFAMPILRITSLRQLVGASRRDVAIVWDVSYSMDYVSGQKNVWAASRDTVVALIEGLRHGDRVCLFLADDDVTPLIEQPTTDLEMVLSQVRALEAGTTASQLRPAVLAALSALKESGKREKELFIITDGQKLPWTSFNPLTRSTAVTDKTNKTDQTDTTNTATVEASSPPWDAKLVSTDISVFAVLLGVSSPDNAAPLDLDIQPTLLMRDTPGQISVNLGHTGPEQTLTVSLTVDEQAASQRSVTLEKDGGAPCVFALPPLTTGKHPARIETSPDGITLDNVFYFLLRVHEKLPVLCVGTEPDAFFLLHALNPGGAATAMIVQRVDPQAFTADRLSDYACVFLCNALPLAGQAMIALEQYAQHGGVVVIFPGDRAAPADYANWTCLPAMPKAVTDFGADAQRRALRLVKRGDALFQGMHVPPGTYPSVAATRELQWTKLGADSDVVIAADNDAPFLLRRKVGKGCVLFFSVSADRRWSNLPLSPFFLPLVHRIVRYSAGQEQSEPFIWTGRNLALADIMGALPPDTELLDPTSRPVLLHPLKAGQDKSLGIEAVTRPGIYTLQSAAGGQPQPALAVNVMRSESDLKRLGPADVPMLTGLSAIKVAESKDDLMQLVKELRIGRPLAETLLWLVFLISIAELFLANRAGRKTRTLTEQLKIDMTGRVKGTAAG